VVEIKYLNHYFIEETMQTKQLVLYIDEVTQKALAEDARRQMRPLGRHALYLLRQTLVQRGLLPEVEEPDKIGQVNQTQPA